MQRRRSRHDDRPDALVGDRRHVAAERPSALIRAGIGRRACPIAARIEARNRRRQRGERSQVSGRDRPATEKRETMRHRRRLSAAATATR